ncbi:tetratricopeptide repeat protein [bacterium]|nr:tetratricopeptide repeat protein [bacterium]
MSQAGPRSASGSTPRAPKSPPPRPAGPPKAAAVPKKPTVPLRQQFARWEMPILAVLLVVLIVIGYISIVGQQLTTWGDDQYISMNRQVLKGISADGISWAFTTTDQANYHPLTWISLMVDQQIHGQRQWGFKLTNVLLHVFNSVLLYLAIFRLSSRTWLSFFVAALFAIHPIHVESVAWASGRKDVLGTFFVFLSLHGYIQFARTKNIAAYIGMIVAYALSLLSNQNFVTFPFVLLLLDYWPTNRLEAGEGTSLFRKTSLVGAILEKIPLFILSILSAVMTIMIVSALPAYETIEFSIPARLGNGVVGYAVYLRKTIAPFDLAFFYPFPKGGHAMIEVIVCSVVVLAITVGAIAARKRAPFVFVGWFWYVISLIPVIGFLQVGHQAYADHFTYFPLIGIFIILTWGVSWLAEKRVQERPAIVGMGFIAVLACLGLTVWQVMLWKNTESIARHALDLNEENAVARIQLSGAFGARGDFDSAKENLIKAVAIEPNNISGLLKLAHLLLMEGDIPQAKELFTKAGQVDPSNESVERARAMFALGEGKVDEGIEHLSKVLEKNPRSGPDMLAAGIAYARKEKYEEAKKYLTPLADAKNEEAKRALELVARLEKADPAARDRFRRQFFWPPGVDGSRILAEQAASLWRRNRISLEMAEKYLAKSVELWPANIDALYNLAVVEVKLNKRQAAADRVQRILQLDPRNKRALDLLKPAS